MKYNVIDLFCGAGGMSKGFSKYTNILLGIDNDLNAIETFKNNHPSSIAICDDIQNVSNKRIEKAIENKRVDIIIGGCPCTPFSLAGKRDTEDDRSSLFLHYCRILKHFQPSVFVFENVVGILSAKNKEGGLILNDVLDEMGGYNVSYEVMNSADYGVPQTRKRFICVGRRNETEFTFPFPTHENNWIAASTILEEKVDEKYYLSQKMIDGMNNRKEKNKEAGKGYGAQFLKENSPSYTISSRYYKDGSDCLIKYSENRIRKLTELECARIQTFPDTFKFHGSSSSIYSQIGNAVPVKLAEVVAKAIVEYLEKNINFFLPSQEGRKSSSSEEEQIFKFSYNALLSMNKTALHNLCKTNGIKGYSSKKKEELVEFCYEELKKIGKAE